MHALRFFVSLLLCGLLIGGPGALNAAAPTPTSGLTLETTVAAGDKIKFVDVSDTTFSTNGTDKQILVSNFLNAANLTGSLAIARFNSGTSASSSTFWRGDGTWAAASASFSDSAGLRALLSDETGTGLAVFGTSPTITTPTLSGIWTAAGARISTTAAMSPAHQIDTAKANQTDAITANSTLTLSATPATGTWFSFCLVADGSGPYTITLPAGTWYSEALGGNRTTFPIGASQDATISVWYDGSIYHLFGDPVTINDLTEDTTPSAANDFVETYDASASVHKKVKIQNLAGTKIVTKSTASNYTVGTTDPREAYGGVIYVTSAATITAPAVAAGMSFTVITKGAIAVSVDVDAADLIIRDGTAQADGEKITNTSTTGDIVVFTYYDATGWYAASNGWTNGG